MESICGKQSIISDKYLGSKHHEDGKQAKNFEKIQISNILKVIDCLLDDMKVVY